MNKKTTLAVSGTVRTSTGVPIEGVMVIGSDLNYVETDKNGFFEFKNPDTALVFWCTGFTPRPQLLHSWMTASGPMDIILNAL